MLDVHFRVLRLWISSWGQRGSALPQLGQAKPPASLDGWTLNQQTVSASLDKCLHEPVPLTVLHIVRNTESPINPPIIVS